MPRCWATDSAWQCAGACTAERVSWSAAGDQLADSTRLPRAAPARGSVSGYRRWRPSMSRCASYSSRRNVERCLRSCVAPRMEVRAPRSSAASSLCEISATCSPSSRRSARACAAPASSLIPGSSHQFLTFARRGRRKFPSLPKLPGGVAKRPTARGGTRLPQHRLRDDGNADYSRPALNAAASSTIPFMAYMACAMVGPPPAVPSQMVSPGAHFSIVLATYAGPITIGGAP